MFRTNFILIVLLFLTSIAFGYEYYFILPEYIIAITTPRQIQSDELSSFQLALFSIDPDHQRLDSLTDEIRTMFIEVRDSNQNSDLLYSCLRDIEFQLQTGSNVQVSSGQQSLIFHVPANEYYFIFHSGYTLRVIIPEQNNPHQVIPSQLELYSNNPDHSQVDDATFPPIIRNMFQIFQQRNFQPKLVYYENFNSESPSPTGANITASVDQQPSDLTGLQSINSEPSVQMEPSNIVEQRDPSISTFNPYCNKYKTVTDANGEVLYPCAFPECNFASPSRKKKTKHHHTHVDPRIFELLGRDEKACCRLCGESFTSYRLFICHLSVSH